MNGRPSHPNRNAFSGHDAHRVDQDAARVLPIADGEIVVTPHRGNWGVTIRHWGRAPRRLHGGLPLGTAEELAVDLARRVGAGVLVDLGAPWRQRPATEPQKVVLRRRGLTIPPEVTAGQASDLIARGVRGGRR